MRTKTVSKSRRELQCLVIKLRKQLKEYEALLLKAAIKAEEVHIASAEAKALNEASKNALKKRNQIRTLN